MPSADQALSGPPVPPAGRRWPAWQAKAFTALRSASVAVEVYTDEDLKSPLLFSPSRYALLKADVAGKRYRRSQR